MDISRLKSLRAGNRAAVTKVFNKLEDAIVDTPLDPEEICTLLGAVKKKKKTLANIDEQILNTVDSEEITDEIIETDEYYLDKCKEGFWQKGQGLHYLHGLSLAQPVTDAESFELTLLIGADFYWNILQEKVIRGNGPTTVSSKLGYLLSGPVPVEKNNQSTSMMNVLISHKQETCDLEKFWKLESLGIDEKEVDTQLIDVMETFAESSITKQNRKYVSKLPWKENCPELPTNKEIVKRRTENVIRRISKDKEMFRMYGDIISDQELRGFIEQVSDETLTENLIHYIPHHAVKKDSTTTPMRIVYNCSCKANSYNASLNDCLAEYPPMMNDLTTILTRFRMDKYAVTADIEKAFLHIELDKNDRDVTRFFWLQNPNNPNSPLITYRFKVVLFGATCSSFIFSATLMKHFRESPSNTSSELQRNLYVDKMLTSFPDETILLKFYAESRTLLHDAGFNLRSWNSINENLRNRAI
ncbi:uncharacterized protein [Mytilus edulis]|uniref:uncharacterized protein n=1 Tax=Mytilus edulis TaxID=6550 RepID=UPI0039EFE4A7